MCSVNTMSMTNRIETETLNILLFRTQTKIRYDSDDFIDHAMNYISIITRMMAFPAIAVTKGMVVVLETSQT